MNVSDGPEIYVRDVSHDQNISHEDEVLDSETRTRVSDTTSWYLMNGLLQEVGLDFIAAYCYQ